MNLSVVPMFRPDVAAMTQHVEHLFGGFLDGLHEGKIELAWTETTPDESGRHKLSHARLYGTDQLDTLVDDAARLNAAPMCNVYIGAALRRPDTAPFGRCDDRDAWALTAVYVDLDDDGSVSRARDIYRDLKPTMAVVTGREPYTRGQCWWRLDEPLTDPSAWPAILRGLATALGGDTTVTNPARVMRLAGSIAWPVKPGRVIEATAIAQLKEPGQPVYSLAHILSAFPAAADDRPTGTDTAAPTERASNSLGLATKIVDGRERYMRDTLVACLIEFVGEHGAAPDAQELFDAAWPQYSRTVDFSRPGRGEAEFREKCAYTVRRFDAGDIRSLETLDKALAAARMKRTAKKGAERVGAAPKQQPSADAGSIYEYLDIPAIKRLPEPAWIVKGLVIEDALGFIYGPPGHGKTFVALSLALHVAYGMTDWWWGREIRRHGLVMYIAREGIGGLKSRIEAWQRTYGIADDVAPFVLVRAGVNFMDPEDVQKLLRTAEDAARAHNAEPALIFVDTVSRVLPGAEENLQKDMTLFVAACDALRDRFRATVVGVHHAGKSGDMRGSTVLRGAGDFVIKIERSNEDDAESAVHLTAEKIKDAEDGWVKQIELKSVEWFEEGRIDGERKSLVALPVEDATEASGKPGGWPTKDVCRQVLAAIGEAWLSGRPWSTKPQTKEEGRYGPRIMFSRWRVPAETGTMMLEEWLINGVLSFEMVDAKAKRMGLKVVGSID